MEKQAPKRYRVTVPAEDTQIHEWADAQQNFSFSVRMLIRDSIARYGITDVTCVPVKMKQGRPTEEEAIARARQVDTPDTVQPVAAQPVQTMPTDQDGLVDMDSFFNTNK